MLPRRLGGRPPSHWSGPMQPRRKEETPPPPPSPSMLQTYAGSGSSSSGSNSLLDLRIDARRDRVPRHREHSDNPQVELMQRLERRRSARNKDEQQKEQRELSDTLVGKGRAPAPRRVVGVLDGFVVLFGSRKEDPEDVEECLLPGRGLEAVEARDLIAFTKLKRVDVSDNHLGLRPFGVLPVLQQLSLACNMLTTLKVDARAPFRHLEELDLSFNIIDPVSIGVLAAMPRLQRLNLGSNDLKTLPRNMSSFELLDELNLEGNNLGQCEHAFASLATLPSLRWLNLEGNGISGVTAELEAETDDPFPEIEALLMQHNKVACASELTAITELSTLQVLVLHDNPLAEQVNEIVDLRRSMPADCQIICTQPGTAPSPAATQAAVYSMADAEMIDNQGRTRPATMSTYNDSQEASDDDDEDDDDEDEDSDESDSIGSDSYQRTGSESQSVFLTQVGIVDEVPGRKHKRRRARVADSTAVPLSPRAVEIRKMMQKLARETDPDDGDLQGVPVRQAIQLLRFALQHPATLTQPKPASPQTKLMVPTLASEVRRARQTQRVQQQRQQERQRMMEQQLASGMTPRRRVQVKNQSLLNSVSDRITEMSQRMACVEDNLNSVLGGQSALKTTPQTRKLLLQANNEYNKLRSTQFSMTFLGNSATNDTGSKAAQAPATEPAADIAPGTSAVASVQAAPR